MYESKYYTYITIHTSILRRGQGEETKGGGEMKIKLQTTSGAKEALF